ncbi:MAG: hypothetical protein WC843_06655, partial [Candidatus Gracilibacteria bacterium]
GGNGDDLVIFHHPSFCCGLKPVFSLSLNIKSVSHSRNLGKGGDFSGHLPLFGVQLYERLISSLKTSKRF